MLGRERSGTDLSEFPYVFLMFSLLIAEYGGDGKAYIGTHYITKQ